MMLTSVIVVVGILLTTSTSQVSSEDPETLNYFMQCEKIVNEIAQEDHAMIVNNSSSILYSTWMSQECEVRAGPEYIIRKYTFFENDTFLLLRHHYAEESCSIATHTVIIRGYLKLVKPSAIVPGATETSFYVESVNIVPLNRQIAHKFNHKLNLTCGPQPRWRPYETYLIYEQPRQHPSLLLWESPMYNSLQAHSTTKKLGLDCLIPFGIEFNELKLLSVQKRSFGDYGTRFELFLASNAPNINSRWIHESTSLQPTAIVRANTTRGCPICGSVLRSTEFSPPLLHVVAALPALIGGYWLSERCESTEGGVWSKRQLQIYSGDKLWTGRWDYYKDPHCSAFSYAITAAGSYIQRAGSQRRYERLYEDTLFDYLNNSSVSMRFFSKRSVIDKSSKTIPYRNNLDAANESLRNKEKSSARVKTAEKIKATRDGEATKSKRSLPDGIYQFLHDAQPSTFQARFAAMLRGHQAHEATTKRSTMSNLLSGTTELDLHIAESILIPGDITVAKRCGAHRADRLLIDWTRDCVPRDIEAPSTLNLRAKLGVNWNGQYTLLLGLRNENLWDAPLRQCAHIPSHNPLLRAHLRRSFGYHYGFSSASTSRSFAWFLFSQFCFCWLYYIVR